MQERIANLLLRDDTQMLPFGDTECEKRWPSMQAFTAHVMATHLRGEPSKCFFCRRSYQHSSARIRHEGVCVKNPNRVNKPLKVKQFSKDTPSGEIIKIILPPGDSVADAVDRIVSKLVLDGLRQFERRLDAETH